RIRAEAPAEGCGMIPPVRLALRERTHDPVFDSRGPSKSVSALHVRHALPHTASCCIGSAEPELAERGPTHSVALRFAERTGCFAGWGSHGGAAPAPKCPRGSVCGERRCCGEREECNGSECERLDSLTQGGPFRERLRLAPATCVLSSVALRGHGIPRLEERGARVRRFTRSVASRRTRADRAAVAIRRFARRQSDDRRRRLV